MPAAAAAVSGGIGLVSGIAQAIGAGRRAKEIQKQIDEYTRQELQNPYNTLQVSTLGADIAREDMARSIATNSNQLARGGLRGIIGGIPTLMAEQNKAEQQIMADLDAQYNRNQLAKAQGNQVVMQMMEQRERDDLLGLGNTLNTSRMEQANGWNNIAQSAIGLTNAAGAGLFKGLGGGNPTGVEDAPQTFQPLLNTNIIDSVGKQVQNDFYNADLFNKARANYAGIYNNNSPFSIAGNFYNSQPITVPRTSYNNPFRLGFNINR